MKRQYIAPSILVMALIDDTPLMLGSESDTIKYDEPDFNEDNYANTSFITVSKKGDSDYECDDPE